MICKHCGTVHSGEHVLPGSGWIELILWLWLIFPGLIYSIWRRSGRPTCTACGSRDLVPETTPVGQQLMRQHYPGGPPQAPPRRPAAPTIPLGRQVLRAATVALVICACMGALLWVAAPKTVAP